jgi:IMP dehydrogenase
MLRKVKGDKASKEDAFLSTFDANCAVAIGATGDYFERAEKLVSAGTDILCVDVAHGDSLIVVESVKKLRQVFPHITLIAGNVATGKGAARLIDSGADAIRVGIGSGAACSTRVMTGSGIPTLQSLFDCQEYLDLHGYKDVCLIADGGIKNGGDIVKSIAAGASSVMLGQLLAATDESPGDLVSNGTMKKYRGMSSYGAQSEWRPETKNNIVPEGEETLLPYKGSVKKAIHELVGGLRSGMTYSNARTLIELQNNAEFVHITSSGWAESKPHAKNIRTI